MSETRRLPEHLRGDGPCMDCGTADTPVWFAPNVIWNHVVGGYAGLLCPECFIKRTDDAGLYVTGWQLVPEFHWETHAERAARIAATEEIL